MIITLFLQYWPKISSSLRSYFRTVPRFGAFPVILCVISGHSVYILFYSSNSVDFRRSRPLARLDFYWLMLNWTFLLSFLTKWLSHFCKMRCRNLIMTVCKCAHRNLKLQLYLVWPTAKKFECIMIFKEDEWPGRKMTISEEIGILNCLLPTMVT